MSLNNKDPLDEIFVDYHKTIIKEKKGQWEFKKIDSDFVTWFNSWADLDGNDKIKSKEFREGYKQAIRDIFERLKLNYKIFDRRTKTGFSKEY